jgi:hypothetical protein
MAGTERGGGPGGTVDSEAEAVLSADFVSCSVPMITPSRPSFCLACPVESKLAPIPTRAIALLKKELLPVIELALQVAAALVGKSRSMRCRVRPSKKAVCLNKLIKLAENASRAQEQESCVR